MENEERLKAEIYAEKAEALAETFFEAENYPSALEECIKASKLYKEANQNIKSAMCESKAGHLEFIIESLEEKC
jgi:hypothetical protein